MSFGFVYIIGFGDPEMVKIGVSDDPSTRIRAVINGLKLNNFNIYISTIHADSYFIESSCHKALSDCCVGGVGAKKKYKREVFEYKFEEAKEILADIISLYEKNHR